jgi:hypothetical protein
VERERPSPSFRKTAPGTRQDEPGASEVVALTKHQMRRQIARRPRVQQRRRLGAELVEQVAEPSSLDLVEERGHGAECSQAVVQSRAR